jgi:hypothetical protein
VSAGYVYQLGSAGVTLLISQNEVLHSPPISLLPKNPLHAPSHNPTFQPASPMSPSSPGSPPGTAETPTTPYIAHHLLPSPSASHPLRKPDQRFHDSEVFTEKFQSHFTSMEKVNRRVTKRWGERAQDMSELGALWNGYSLLEKGKLGEAVEKVGQAVDGEYLATAALVCLLYILEDKESLADYGSYKHGNALRPSHCTSTANSPL